MAKGNAIFWMILCNAVVMQTIACYKIYCCIPDKLRHPIRLKCLNEQKKIPLSTKKTAQNRTKPASKIKYKIYTMDGNCERINISVGDFCVCGLFFLCGVCLCVCVQECHGKKRNFKALIFIELSIEDGPFRLQNIFDALCLAYKRTEASARELTI